MNNYAHIRASIYSLVSYENSLDRKHEMLTAIGLATGNDETFKICEEIRNDLPECPTQIQVERSELLRSANVPQFCTEDNSRLQELNDLLGDE